MRINFFEGDISSSLSLEHRVDRIALEASFLTNAVHSLKNVVPNLTSTFTNLVTGFKTQEFNHNQDILKKVSKEASDIASSISYNDISNLDRYLVTIPEGFDGNLLTYTEMLLKITPSSYDLVNNALTDLNMYLSKFISNSDTKSSSKDILKTFEEYSKQREGINKAIAAFFSDKDIRSKAYFTDVVYQLSELDKLYKKSCDIADIVSPGKARGLESKVKETVRLLNMVHDSLVNDESKVSGQAAKNIAKASYEVAKCVEFIGIYHFKVEQVVGCTANLMKELHRVLKYKRD